MPKTLSILRQVLFGLCVAPWLVVSGLADTPPFNASQVANNISIVNVTDEGVTIDLEIFLGDLGSFSDLLPARLFSQIATGDADDALRLARFAENGISLRRGDGSVLPLSVKFIEPRLRVDRASPLAGQPDPLSGRSIPAPPDDPRVVFVRMFYSFEGQKPDVIEFLPPRDAEGVPVVIGAHVSDRGLTVSDFRFFARAMRLHMNWDDPWYTRFDDPNLVRHQNSPRTVFLYAEPYEIRQEALVRVRDAADLAGFQVKGQSLSAEDAQKLAEAAVQEIEARSRLTIENRPTTPDFDRGAFMRIGMGGLELLEPGEKVDVDAHILGLIWSAPVDGLPEKAALEWEWFDAKTPEITAYSIDAAGPFLSPITPDDPVLVWTNHFKVNPYRDVTEITVSDGGWLPVTAYILSCVGTLGMALVIFSVVRRRDFGRLPVYVGVLLVVAGFAGAAFTINRDGKLAADVSAEELAVLAEDLLNNVYRAFGFRTENQVYDRLELTLYGDALEEVYLAQRDALRIDRAGGAKARVTALEVQDVTRLGAESGVLRLQTDWTVTGQVGHWGHAHSRTNAYIAELVVAPVYGSWKILEFDILREDRLR